MDASTSRYVIPVWKGVQLNCFRKSLPSLCASPFHMLMCLSRLPANIFPSIIARESTLSQCLKFCGSGAVIRCSTLQFWCASVRLVMVMVMVAKYNYRIYLQDEDYIVPIDSVELPFMEEVDREMEIDRA